jgi:hypothetical protein
MKIKYIGHGRMRIAFQIGNFAVKIPFNWRGVKACREEATLWLQHRLGIMAPVLYNLWGFAIIMPYYSEKFNGPRPEEFIAELNKLGIIDLYPYNIRMANGQPIAIDYAINYNSSGQGTPTGEEVFA